MEYKSAISKELRKPLPLEMVEFRVQSVSPKGYITILAYKDARCDMQRLDEVVGCMNWKREHSRENKNCTVSIWDDEKKQWISKEDTGTESFTEKEKGLASDSFKRACFNWGIGIELYDYPQIFFQLYENEYKKSADGKKATTTYDFKLKKWKWEMENKDGKIFLKGTDENGRLRYDSEKDFNAIPKTNEPPAEKKEPKKTVSGKMLMSEATYNKAIKSDKDDILTQALTKYDLTPQQVQGISKRIAELKNKK